MHLRNGDAPYVSAAEAMRYWPETATAVAVRRNIQEECEIAAPFGLDDLLGLILRPTPRFAGEKHPIYKERLRSKQWTVLWPLLKQAEVEVSFPPPAANRRDGSQPVPVELSTPVEP